MPFSECARLVLPQQPLLSPSSLKYFPNLLNCQSQKTENSYSKVSGSPDSHMIWVGMGFLGGASVKEPACQCRRCQFHAPSGIWKADGKRWPFLSAVAYLLARTGVETFGLIVTGWQVRPVCPHLLYGFQIWGIHLLAWVLAGTVWVCTWQLWSVVATFQLTRWLPDHP